MIVVVHVLAVVKILFTVVLVHPYNKSRVPTANQKDLACQPKLTYLTHASLLLAHARINMKVKLSRAWFKLALPITRAPARLHR